MFQLLVQAAFLFKSREIRGLTVGGSNSYVSRQI